MSAIRASLPLLAGTLLLGLAGCAGDDATALMPDAASATMPLAAAAPAAAAGPPGQAADAREEMGRAMAAFLAVRSYHARMATASPQGTTTLEMDFVAPDRFRVRSPAGTQVVIGDTMYMAIDGRTMKMALPRGQATQWRDPAQLEANKATMRVDALGRDTVDGQPTRKYRVRNSQPQPSESVLWINGDGYPVKMEVAGQGDANVRMTVRYSRFNDPAIRIDPP